MPATTFSTGFAMNAKDLGESHEMAHSNEHDWRNYDDKNVPNVETLSNENGNLSATEKAFQVAQKQGLMTEKEFLQDQAKQIAENATKGKRNKADLAKFAGRTYRDYVEAISLQQTRALEKQKALTSDAKAKGSSKFASKQLNLIKANKGLAITGNLYYLANQKNYQEVLENFGKEGLKRFRNFEREALKDFYNSDIFQALHPQSVRVQDELHSDEKGTQHIQSAEVWGRTDKQGHYHIARTQMQGDILANLGYETLLDSISPDKKNRERQATSAKLYSALNRHALATSALKKSKELLEPYGMSWEYEQNISDGIHRTKDEYMEHEKLKEVEALKQEYQKAKELEEKRTKTIEEFVESYNQGKYPEVQNPEKLKAGLKQIAPKPKAVRGR